MTPEKQNDQEKPKNKKDELQDLAAGLSETIKKDKVKDKEVKEKRKKGKKTFPVALAVLLGVLAIAIIFLIWNPQRMITYGHPVHAGDAPAKWSGALEDAVEVLWKYSAEIDQFLYENKRYPNTLQEIAKDDPELPEVCPGTGQKFKYSAGQKSFRLEAPSPSKLGISALYLSQKSTKPVIER